jgi:hypothetical protein
MPAEVFFVCMLCPANAICLGLKGLLTILISKQHHSCAALSPGARVCSACILGV